jgi:ribonucleotide reductase class II
MNRYGLNPCGEIIGSNFFCNLVEVHLNQLTETTLYEQERSLLPRGLQCAALLSHEFDIEKFRYSREVDPIVGVSFTGLFDFFVNHFGSDWLLWWEEGRPENWYRSKNNTCVNMGATFKEEEALILSRWREAAEQGVKAYCEREGLRVPNRCTTVQPAGTKSLLTGASPGWHPPKAPRFLRRITFAKNDAVAKACIDYGYQVTPSQSDTDEEGNLLTDPFDPRCTEWLVEIPVEVPWANLPGADTVNTSKFSVKAQFDFYMQVQTYYTTHNTSATIEYREEEIEEFSDILYDAIQKDKGYTSAAMMARFDVNETMPRLPFEPISKEVYEEEMAGVLERRKSDDFYSLLMQYDTEVEDFAGPAGCDSSGCLLPEVK